MFQVDKSIESKGQSEGDVLAFVPLQLGEINDCHDNDCTSPQ